MKRNTLTAWLLGIILIFSATSCFNGPIVKGSKNYITKKENLEHFNDISMSGSANITYQQDSSSRIEIYGSDNIVELLETKVNGETLNIKFKKNVKTKKCAKKKNSLTVSKLKAKKKYYVRIRKFWNVKKDGKKSRIYGSFSKVKKVKVR